MTGVQTCALPISIPGNDDAIRAVSLYCELLSGAVLDGIRAEIAAQQAEARAQASAEAAAREARIAAAKVAAAAAGHPTDDDQ